MPDENNSELTTPPAREAGYPNQEPNPLPEPDLAAPASGGNGHSKGLSGSILIAALLICGSIFYNTKIIIKKLDSLQSNVLGASTTKIATGLEEGNLKRYAKNLKLDTAVFDSCLDNSQTAEAVSQDMAEALRLGVDGTPTFFINGEKIVGAQSVATFTQAIDNALAKVAVKNSVIVEDRDGQPVIGNPNAQAVMYEFADFQCPYCKRFFKETYPQIKSKYIDTGKLEFIYRQFPLSFHQDAQKAAQASECASKQGKFEDYYNILFSNSQS